MAGLSTYPTALDTWFDHRDYVGAGVAISLEAHSVPGVSPYTFTLNYIPMNETPSTVTIAGFSEVTTAPSTGQFQVNYTTGVITFNSANANASVNVSYRTQGSKVYASHINKVQDAINALETELGATPKGSFASASARLTYIENKFASSGTGHTHSGNAGDGPQLPASSISGFSITDSLVALSADIQQIKIADSVPNQSFTGTATTLADNISQIATQLKKLIDNANWLTAPTGAINNFLKDSPTTTQSLKTTGGTLTTGNLWYGTIPNIGFTGRIVKIQDNSATPNTIFEISKWGELITQGRGTVSSQRLDLDGTLLTYQNLIQGTIPGSGYSGDILYFSDGAITPTALARLTKDGDYYGRRLVFTDSVATTQNLWALTGPAAGFTGDFLRFIQSGNGTPVFRVDYAGEIWQNGIKLAVSPVGTDQNSWSINKDVTGTPTEDLTLIFERGTSADGTLKWNETTDGFELSHKLQISGGISFQSSGTGTYYVTLANTEALGANRALTLALNTSDRTIDLSGNLTLANAFITAGNYSLTLTTTGITNVTLPTTGTLSTLAGIETFTNKTVTSPDINAGTVDSLTSLSIRDTSAAYDVTLAAVSSVALTANRTVTLDTINVSRSIKLAGNIDIANNLVTAGNYSLTLTTTATTNVTLPTTGTLSTLAGAESLSNKILDNTTTLTIKDASFTLQDNVDTTKQLTFQLSGITTGTTRTLTVPNADTTLVGTDTTDTLSNKTLTAPDINAGTVDSLTSLSIRDTSAAYDLTLIATSSTALTAGRSITLDVINVSRTIKLAGNIDIGGNLTLANALITSGNYSLTLTTTATTSITLPTTGTLSTLAGSEIFTNKTLTAPDINAGTADSLTSLSIRDTSAAYDVVLAAVSSVTLTTNRTLTIDMTNNARSIKLAGNIDIANNLVTSGNYSLTFTTTGITSITLPTTGTLSTLAGIETFTNKTLTAPTIADLTNAQHPHTGASSGGALTVQAIPGTFQANTTATGYTTTSGTYTNDTQLGTVTVVDPGYNYVLEVIIQSVLANDTSGQSCYATVGVDGVSQEAIVEAWSRQNSSSPNDVNTSNIHVFLNLSTGANKAITLMVKSSDGVSTAYSGVGLRKRLETRIGGRQ